RAGEDRPDVEVDEVDNRQELGVRGGELRASDAGEDREDLPHHHQDLELVHRQPCSPPLDLLPDPATRCRLLVLLAPALSRSVAVRLHASASASASASAARTEGSVPPGVARGGRAGQQDPGKPSRNSSSDRGIGRLRRRAQQPVVEEVHRRLLLLLVVPLEGISFALALLERGSKGSGDSVNGAL
ncbi:unnamed protein product, partial [Ectocarpus sp. 8 AP-2014]